MQSGSQSDQDTLKAVKFFLKNARCDQKAACLGNAKESGPQKQQHSLYTLGHYFSSLTSKDARGTWLQGRIGPNSPHYMGNAMRLILPGGMV